MPWGGVKENLLARYPLQRHLGSQSFGGGGSAKLLGVSLPALAALTGRSTPVTVGPGMNGWQRQRRCPDEVTVDRGLAGVVEELQQLDLPQHALPVLRVLEELVALLDGDGLPRAVVVRGEHRGVRPCMADNAQGAQGGMAWCVKK